LGGKWEEAFAKIFWYRRVLGGAVRVNIRQAREILGLRERFSKKELSSAYKKAAKESHPDTGAPSWRFREVREAYECLSDSNTYAPPAQSRSEVLHAKPSLAPSRLVFVVALVLCIYVVFALLSDAPAQIGSNRPTETEIAALRAGTKKNDWSRLERGMSQIQVINTVGLPESKVAHSDALDAKWEYWLYPFPGDHSLNWLITFRDGSMQHVRAVSQGSQRAR